MSERGRRVLIAAGSMLALLAAPAVASAATQVAVQQVNGLDVVVADDEDSAAVIDVKRGDDPTDGQTVTAAIVACLGDFDAVVVFGDGGNDKITLDLIEDGFPALHGEAIGGDGEDELTATPDNRDVPARDLSGGRERQRQGDRTETNVIAIGNDTIRARDGAAEQVNCGIGADTAQVDASDVVDPSCESVDRPVVIDGPGLLAFGSKTLVTRRLGALQIRARGPLPVRVANANAFAVTGSVSGQTTGPVVVSRRRVVRLKATAFSVAANARKTVKLKLPRPLQRLLKRTGKLSLRLTMKVKDPAGTTRTVKKRLTVRLKR
jgi:hypothetical protein